MKRWTRQIIASAVMVLGLAPTAQAALGDPSASSPNYRVVEGELGGNGGFSSSSSNFNVNPATDDAGSSLGETAVGGSASTNFQTGSGFNTTAQPSLTFVVNTTTVALGVLSTSAASFGTATFSVKDYTSYGYAVSLVGSPPANNGHALAALTTDTASAAGSEQFGINAVRNTSAAQGAGPVQAPDSTFSYGVAGDGITGVFGSTRPYTISDKWRYNPGETVASGPKSSGETDFTLSFLANISPVTPGGTYTGALQIIATGTY